MSEPRARPVERIKHLCTPPSKKPPQPPPAGRSRTARLRGGRSRHSDSTGDLPGDGPAPGLRVEIDGEEVGLLSFRAAAQPRAAAAVQALRASGSQVFLLSARPAEETGELARLLGADLHGGEFSPAEKLRFMQGLGRRGVLATYVGDGLLDPDLAACAHVAVSLGGPAGLAGDAADIVVLGGTLEALAETAALAQSQPGRVQAACRRALAPNLLCIAGGYAGVLNGITSGVIANIGVSRVYRQAVRSLRDGQRQAGAKRIAV